MSNGASDWFARLSTPAKLLLILSAVLLPIGLALVIIAQQEIGDANKALRRTYEDEARSAARAIESLIARNALALRVAANGRIDRTGDPCGRVRQSLLIAPAVAHDFELRDIQGQPICATEEVEDWSALPLIAPGDIHLQIAPDEQSVVYRVGVIGGLATASVPIAEIRAAAEESRAKLDRLVIEDGKRQLTALSKTPAAPSGDRVSTEWPLGGGRLTARVEGQVPKVATMDKLLLSLPLLMWVAAALLTWGLVTRLLIRPLLQLRRAVSRYQPGDHALDLPRKMGPAMEIQELADAFRRAINRVDESEREMAAALDGQRRLVREVHHRVKNNLQVVASLLNIHGRSADGASARAAYASIARRVGALSIVHRNHFAEMEESRGIALRPLVTELAAELRAAAPENARSFTIELDLDPVNTTQDVAVAVAFLVTEIVEFAMLRCPTEPAEVAIRRTSELTARLDISSPVLVPEESESAEKAQFERIVTGLARQLRSTLERKLGRYSVDLPVFPA